MGKLVRMEDGGEVNENHDNLAKTQSLEQQKYHRNTFEMSQNEYTLLTARPYYQNSCSA